MAEELKGRVLVIDDSPTNAAIVRISLEQAGYEVSISTSGREGLDAALSMLPDVVLVDILMPDIDGYEVCRQIRATPATSGIPVIVLTGLRGDADRILALELGANDFLSKPVDSSELLARVGSLARLKHLNDQLQRQAALSEAAAGRERIATILESITDAFVAVDGQWRFTYVNQRAEQTLGQPREKLLGSDFWEYYATAPDSPAVDESRRAMTDHVPTAFEAWYPPLDAWFETHVYPRDEGLAFYFHDVTARKRAEFEIHELNAFLEQRVRERTEELEHANRQLDAASRMKSEFLASMSHELRTPLNAIIGFSELLLDSKFDDMRTSERTEFLGHINRSGQHLLELINDILDLSKVEAGRMELHLERVPLGQLIQGCLAVIQPLAYKKHIELQGLCEPAGAMLTADPARIKQVLYNLLSNAVKFTPEGGHVTVTAEEADEVGARIAVRDDGVGIRREDQATVFEEFRQVGETSRQQEGTGLGLALVRRLVELHGGSIHLDSSPGTGSCFTFTIPAALAAALLPPPATAQSDAAAPHPAHTDCPNASVATEGKLRSGALRIVVVEDDREAAELLMLHLTRAGYDVYRASSLEETLEMVRNVRPFAVTLDILMPGHDGWEILSALKADPATHDVPVVVLSVVDNRELGFALGATDYLLKPFDRETLLAALQHVGRHSGPGAGGPRVLVVDDDPAARALYASILENAGCEVTLVENGIEAVRLARHEPVDLMLLDLMMPNMSGFEVVRELRSFPETSSLPIVICTAKELSDLEREELRGHVEAIVEKDTYATDVLIELLHLERFRPDLAGIIGEPTGHAAAAQFLPHLERELSRAGRYQRPFSIVRAQVHISPTEHGTSADREPVSHTLARLTECWSNALRRHEVVAHDDDEILVLLPETAPTQVAAVVAKLQRATIAAQTPIGALPEMAVVFGSASYPGDARTAGELLTKVRGSHARLAIDEPMSTREKDDGR